MPARTVETERDRDTWFPFPGYEDRYEITRDGRVRGIARYINAPQSGGTRLWKGGPLRPANVKGYLALQPTVNGVRRTAYLHRAIATLFVPNPDNKPHVNHLDGNKQNNAPANLQWCTHKENMRHAFSTGLAKARESGPGEKSPAAKLNDQSVAAIKRRLLQGEQQITLAAEFGVTKGTIGFIARGETWAHIEPERDQ